MLILKQTRSLYFGLLFYFLTLLSSPLYAVTNSVTIKDLSGAVQNNRALTISRVFAKGDIPNYAQAKLNGTALNTQCDVKTRWADGSLQHALISFRAGLPASGSVTIDFIDQANGNNTGFLIQADMLSGAYNFGAQIEVTNGTALTADARAMLNSGAFRYWLQGPLCTQVIIEDRTSALAHDLGWDSHKPLHPIFVATFYPGDSAVKVEMILENMWTTKLEDVTYSLALKTQNPLNATPVFTKASSTHIACSRWRKTFWSGRTPGGINIDYNLKYLCFSRVIPQYDTTLSLSLSAVNDELQTFNAGDQGELYGSGQWCKYFGTTGGRADIGLFPRWVARYLYTFDPALLNVVLSNAEVSGYIPIHLRESATGKFFDSTGANDAFGRPFSVDARPSSWMLDGRDRPYSDPADLITPVGTITSNDWGPDLAHQGSFAYIPYLITGDWYFLEEAYFWGSYDLGASNPGDCDYCRHYAWGFLNESTAQMRGQAWGLRNLAHAAFAAPDGSPEKIYFTQKLNYNIAVREGALNAVNGTYYSTVSTSPWQWGRNVFFGGKANALGFLGKAGHNASGVSTSVNTALCQSTEPYWQENFIQVVLGHIYELGYSQIEPLKNSFARRCINTLANPAFNPYAGAETYYGPMMDSQGEYFTSYPAILNAYFPAYLAECETTYNQESDYEHGYGVIAHGAASFMTGLSDGTVTGQAAWDWIHSTLPNQNLFSFNPKWAFIPRVPALTAVESAVGIENARRFCARPNPFNPQTTFYLPSTEINKSFTLRVYDMQGRLVRDLTPLVHAGKSSVQWNASRMPSGIYMVKLNRGTQTYMEKVVLLK